VNADVVLESVDQIIGEWNNMTSKDFKKSNSEWLSSRHNTLIANHSGQEIDITIAKKLPNLIFVFDEAHHLIYSKEGVNKNAVILSPEVEYMELNSPRKTDVYCLLRGTLRRAIFYWKNCLSITISTVAKFSSFYPSVDSDPSARRKKVSNAQLVPPLVLKRTFDSYSFGSVSKLVTSDWIKFLFSGARALTLTQCGRPLWGAYYGKVLFRDFNESFGDTRLYDIDVCRMKQCFSFFTNDMMSMVLNRLGELPTIIDSRLAEIDYGFVVNLQLFTSIMSLSVGLSKTPADVDLAELVRAGCFNLLSVNSHNNSVVGMFCSEGIFNGAASVVLCRYINTFFMWLHDWLSSSFPCFVNIGEVGELVDRMLLIEAVMNSKRIKFFERVKTVTGKAVEDENIKKNFCESIYEPVGLEDFLNAFVGETECKEYLDSIEELKGAFLAFNHFTFLGCDDVHKDPYGACANYLSRGAAIIPKPYTKGFDVMIPLVLADKRLSFIYVQTKCGKSFESKAKPSAEDVLNGSPHAAFKGKLGKRGEEVPYCYIYHYVTSSPYNCKTLAYEEKPPNDSNVKKAKVTKNGTKAKKNISCEMSPLQSNLKKVRISTDNPLPPNTNAQADSNPQAIPDFESEDLSPVTFHFPCLFIRGIRNPAQMLSTLLEYLKDKKGEVWMEKDKYAKSTLSLPVEDVKEDPLFLENLYKSCVYIYGRE
jgi:hypothetical protein